MTIEEQAFEDLYIGETTFDCLWGVFSDFDVKIKSNICTILLRFKTQEYVENFFKSVYIEPEMLFFDEENESELLNLCKKMPGLEKVFFNGREVELPK